MNKWRNRAQLHIKVTTMRRNKQQAILFCYIALQLSHIALYKTQNAFVRLKWRRRRDDTKTTVID